MPAIRTAIPNAMPGVDFRQAVGYRRYAIGVDLAAINDYTAVAVILDEQIPLPRWGNGLRQSMGPHGVRSCRRSG